MWKKSCVISYTQIISVNQLLNSNLWILSRYTLVFYEISIFCDNENFFVLHTQTYKQIP